jgi:serine/threonine-protein kinase
LSEFELGTTYEAFDILKQQTVIVKKFTSSFFDLRFFNRLQNAVEAVSQLNHPHLVPLLDSLWERSAFYLINEAHNKQTLFEILSHIKSFSIDQTLPIIRPVAKVLEYVHQKGLRHGTLNDENVLILKDGSIKVKNFLIEDLISQFCLKKGVLITKTGFLAPEQLRGETSLPQSDVFALGALIYQMLTGTQAFAGQNESIRFHKNLTSQPIPPSLIEKNIPEPVEKMILRALAKNPYERYETPLELLRDFEMQHYTAPLFVRPYQEERPQDNPHDKLEEPMKFDELFDENKPPRAWVKPLEPHLKKVLDNKKVSQVTENVVERVERHFIMRMK